MKQSRTAFFITMLGNLLFFLGFIFFVFSNDQNQITLGLAGMTLLWVMGVQYDLYEYGKKKEETKT